MDTQYALQDGEMTKGMFADVAKVSTKTVENWVNAGKIEGEYKRRQVEGKPVRKTLIISRPELSKVDQIVKTVPIVKSQEQAEQVAEATGRILQAIADLRRERNERSAKVDSEVEEIKQSQFSFDVRLEKAEARDHEALNIGYDLRANIKVLTAEVRKLSADVASLQQKDNLLPQKID